MRFPSKNSHASAAGLTLLFFAAPAFALSPGGKRQNQTRGLGYGIPDCPGICSKSGRKINPKSEPAVANAIEAVSRVLSHENFVRPDPGKEFKICVDHPNALGFTAKNRMGIPVRPSGICERGLSQSNRDLAQTIIHEAAHQGYPTVNECAATFAELEIVIQGGGVPYKNIYVSKCPQFKVLSRFRLLD